MPKPVTLIPTQVTSLQPTVCCCCKGQKWLPPASQPWHIHADWWLHTCSPHKWRTGQKQRRRIDRLSHLVLHTELLCDTCQDKQTQLAHVRRVWNVYWSKILNRNVTVSEPHSHDSVWKVARCTSSSANIPIPREMLEWQITTLCTWISLELYSYLLQ